MKPAPPVTRARARTRNERCPPTEVFLLACAPANGVDRHSVGESQGRYAPASCMNGMRVHHDARFPCREPTDPPSTGRSIPGPSLARAPSTPGQLGQLGSQRASSASRSALAWHPREAWAASGAWLRAGVGSGQEPIPRAVPCALTWRAARLPVPPVWIVATARRRIWAGRSPMPQRDRTGPSPRRSPQPRGPSGRAWPSRGSGRDRRGLHEFDRQRLVRTSPLRHQRLGWANRHAPFRRRRRCRSHARRAQ
jgi:hypothetical protein